jgi:3-hydroxyacyl-CoA dehydrogenase / enoyl-CoA hydratase / 3-hydroxybutyryl-CoA epimerase / enoyl-CoA isomerase
MSEEQVLFRGRHLLLRRLDQGLLEICFDRIGESVNTLNADCLRELAQVVKTTRAMPELRGTLMSSPKTTFLAGADIDALWQLLHRSEAEQAAFSTQMHAVFSSLEDLPVPVVCAINGYALGGGLEAALCADYRVIDVNAKIGFPEVGFGILPGAGGTVRSPRLAGSSVALEWLCQGRQHASAAALEAGMVDAVADLPALRDTALAWLHRAINGELDWRARREQRRGGFELDPSSMAAVSADAQKASRHYPAAQVIADLIERCAPLSRNAALQQEALAFAKLAQTDTAKALVGVFMAGQHLRKHSKLQSRATHPVRRAAVLGAGIMGGGIAYTTALKGLPVVMKDIAQSQLDLGMNEARKLLGRQRDGGRLDAARADSVLAAISPTLDYEHFAEVDVVVEAVVENLQVKQTVLREVEAASGPETVLASNTSSLLIADIGASLTRPQNLVGMHFFNPVHMMPLVEIVRGPQSSEAAVATAVAYALAIGKTPLVVADCAGFLVNRLLGAYFTALMQLLRDGADFVQIDRALETWGWPMGPCYLLDVAGIDTLDKAMTILGHAYPTVMGTDFPTAIQCLSQAGRYGQKTGAGFFGYAPDARGKPRRTPDSVTRDLLAAIQPQGPRAFNDAEIVDRMMLAMMLEADRCLESGIIGSALELDAGMRLGAGFPAHAVGPLWTADRIGCDVILRRCERHRSLGGLFEPGPGLRRRAASQEHYYPTPDAGGHS